MPRKAADALVVPIPTISKRLHPPPGLSERAKAEFVRIVTTEKPTHFTSSDLSLLVQYCEAAALAERAMKEMQCDGAPERWLTVWEKSVRMMKDLALRLRLSPQSRMPNNPTRRLPERVCYYEREALEHGGAEQD
jgi:phage terminase small subunit